MAELKFWNGSAWTKAKAVYVWNGSSWVEAEAVHIWDGSSWVEAWPKRYLSGSTQQKPPASEGTMPDISNCNI